MKQILDTKSLIIVHYMTSNKKETVMTAVSF